MKLKNWLFILCIALCTTPVLGASMCVPPLDQSINTSGIHGQFAWGGTCSINSNQEIECSQPPLARGESYCSASGTYSADNWGTDGGYCWCRAIAIQTSDGILVERSGAWLFGNFFGDATNCSNACAGFCAYFGGASRGFRVALLTPTGK